MRWGKILKASSPDLDGLKYNDSRVKQYLRTEGKNRCVYCAINESVLGGYQFFWVEHLRPQSDFPELADNLENLFYSCSICNRFKSNDWPNDNNDDYMHPCYPDPSKVDYAEIFDFNDQNGLLEGKFPASRYMESKLFLNRPQLILERMRFALNERCEGLIGRNSELNQELKRLADQKEALEHMQKMSELTISLLRLKQNLESIPPYELNDVTR